MKKHLLLSFTWIYLLPAMAFCQTVTSPLQTAFANLKTQLTDHIVEKAYLQLDRPYPYYVAGETVYFKAYVTMGERHEPSLISGILHVDLINHNAEVVQTHNISLNGGTGWGDFIIPENFAKGTYTIRAYTNWMRNEKDPEYFYKGLSISSSNSTDRVTNNASQTAQPSLQFFPEGGSFVTGLPSKIAFKAIGTDGLGLNLTGIITDNNNKEVARIMSSHLGMGAFDLVPEAGKTYKAKVMFADGTALTQILPTADESGTTLAVNTENPDKITVDIRANNAYYKTNFNKDLELVIYAAGVAQEYRPKLDNPYLSLDLPVKKFKTGIIRVSLFTAGGEPLNERMIFVHGDDVLSLAINSDKQIYLKHEQVKIDLNARLKDQNAGSGSFSVSVIDENKILTDEDAGTSNIAYFLLTSEVKGIIERPDYYFNNVTKQTLADLDVLMLTQAYRRFVWKEFMQNSSNTGIVFRPETGLTVAGNLNTKTGKAIANCAITLIGDTGGPVYTGVTDEYGKFSFDNIPSQSSSHFILKVPSSSSKNAVLTLREQVPAPVVNTAALQTTYDYNADILASLQSSQDLAVFTAATSGNSDLLLKNDAGTFTNNDNNYRSSNLGGPGHADQVISGDQLKNLPTLSTGLSGLARGVQFNSGVPSLQTGMVVSNGQQSVEPMTVFVDGTDLGGGISVDAINPQSVETVEILKGPSAAIYGLQGGEGVMVITTRQGGNKEDVFSKEMAPGIYSLQPKGFYKARDFYAPVYNAKTIQNAPDHRTTIFWKPDVTTDTNGNASFSYFNSDGTGTYRVCIEGIDSNGNLGRQVFRYQVK